MRGMQRIRVGMRGMGWECEESGWKCWKSGWESREFGESGWKYGNQSGDVENQGRKLGITVEMTKNSSRNNKFKEWREVKIIENEHICKNLGSHIWSGVFLVNFGYFSYDIFFYYWLWTGKYRLGWLKKLKFYGLVPLFRPSVFRVVFSLYSNLSGILRSSVSQF